MATSMPKMGSSDSNVKAAAGKTAAPLPESEGEFFLFIERNKIAVLSSPFCLAAIMISLDVFAGERVRAVIDFLTGITQR